jgi:capsular polysaccharide export protein
LFYEAGARLPPPAPIVPFHSPFWRRAVHDVVYHVASSANPLAYRGYRTHAPVTAPVEYAGYIHRFSRLRFLRARDEGLINALIARPEPLFLLPLQMNSDAQIRDHSRFEGMAEAIAYVVESFARYAPADANLLIKNHPLDMGLVNYGKIINKLINRFDLAGRVHYVETGNLSLILRHAQGLVTVNSTVGAVGLDLGCPTITLSDPIYNLPGLCFQGALDQFWTELVKPDAELFRRFRNTVIHTTQVNGGFYCCRGIDLAVRNSLRLLEPDQSPLEELLCAVPRPY